MTTPNYIDSLLAEQQETYDELTTWYQALTFMFPASYLTRITFKPKESEIVNGVWYVVFNLSRGKTFKRPIPDEFVYKFKHLDEGPMIEDDTTDEAITNWKEILIDWARG